MRGARSRAGRLLWALLAGVTSASAGALEVQGLRLWAGPEQTRVVLDVSEPAEHRLFTLENPARVVIDLKRANWPDPAAPVPEGTGVVGRIRRGERPNGDLRIVLDLTEPVHPRSFPAAPNEVYGHRLVVDLVRAQSEPVAVKTLPVGNARDLIIAIDAGHGGEDPGAIGKRGTREKDVVMAIARELARLVEDEPGMRPVLVRNGDYMLSLRRRIEIAREQRADMFLSIHADAFRDGRASGASVYALSERGATSEAARWLAERENAADLIGGVSLDDKDDVLASVLLDLSQTATISASLRAGENVLSELGRVGRVRKGEVQQAGFLVLKSPDIPSILVETAYISNPDEEQRLRDGLNQHRWAEAMLGGIRRYFYDNPPEGTRVASLAQRGGAVTYIIVRGDTLSSIASRFNVSLRDLRAANGIHGDGIRTGQVLSIPLAGT